MRNNIGWNWGSVTTYTVYSNTTNNTSVFPKKVQRVFEKTRYEIWVEALGQLLEEGFEIDIVTGGVIT
jgi:hypothetical protein